jgi:hypothetical protein
MIHRRRVHFNDAENDTVQVSIQEIRPLSDYEETEKSATWYRTSDFKHIKAIAKSIALGIREQEGGDKQKYSYSKVLLAAFEAAGTDDHQHEDGGISNTESKYLHHWIRAGHSRRGLERKSIPTLHYQLSHCREAAVRAVIDLQNNPELLEQLASRGEEKCDVIAAVYSQMVKAAGNFARLLGEADEAAACSERYCCIMSTSDHQAIIKKKTPPSIIHLKSEIQTAVRYYSRLQYHSTRAPSA